MIRLPDEFLHEALVAMLIQEMNSLHAEMVRANPADRPAMFEEIQKKIRVCHSLGHDITATKVEK